MAIRPGNQCESADFAGFVDQIQSFFPLFPTDLVCGREIMWLSLDLPPAFRVMAKARTEIMF